eukprot:4466372-Pyramimonas_sp.AAC.1
MNIAEECAKLEEEIEELKREEAEATVHSYPAIKARTRSKPANKAIPSRTTSRVDRHNCLEHYVLAETASMVYAVRAPPPRRSRPAISSPRRPPYNTYHHNNAVAGLG